VANTRQPAIFAIAQFFNFSFSAFSLS